MTDVRRRRIRELIEPLRVKPGRQVQLPDDFDPAYVAPGTTKDNAGERLGEGVEMLSEYQARLAAQDTFGLLVILQAMDAAGKDGTIRHVLSGVSPVGVSVHSFKAPTAEELDHDYLWRHARALPARGGITIFNRSHYEEVLIVRVHPEILASEKLPEAARRGDLWTRRFREINDWERCLVDNGIRIVKLFLNVSKAEQRERFLDRIAEPDRNWKFQAADVRERRHWDAYQAAYSDVLTHTSTAHAPWFVIPADHKWFMRIAAAAVILDAIMDIDPQYPVAGAEARTAMDEAKAELLAER